MSEGSAAGRTPPREREGFVPGSVEKTYRTPALDPRRLSSIGVGTRLPTTDGRAYPSVAAGAARVGTPTSTHSAPDFRRDMVPRRVSEGGRPSSVLAPYMTPRPLPRVPRSEPDWVPARIPDPEMPAGTYAGREDSRDFEDPWERGGEKSETASTTDADFTGGTESAQFFVNLSKAMEAIVTSVQNMQPKPEKTDRRGKAKMKAPSAYDGSYTVLHNVLDFLADIENYLMGMEEPKSAWIRITNTYLTGDPKTEVNSTPFGQGQGDWDDYRAFLIDLNLDKGHEDRLRRYRAKIKQTGPLLRYIRAFEKLVLAYDRAGMPTSNDEAQWVYDFISNLSDKDDRLHLTLAKCQTIRQVTGLARLLDSTKKQTSNAADEEKNDPPRKFSQKGRFQKRRAYVAEMGESDEVPSEDSEDGDEGTETCAIVIVDLARKKLGPMTPELRKLRLKTNACMACGEIGHVSKGCPNMGKIGFINSVDTRKTSTRTRNPKTPKGQKPRVQHIKEESEEEVDMIEEEGSSAEEEEEMANAISQSRSASRARSSKNGPTPGRRG